MLNYINNISSDTLLYLAKTYCNINFTKEEIDNILPYIKSISLDYYNNKCSRDFYKEELKKRTKEETYNKILIILKKFNLE